MGILKTDYQYPGLGIGTVNQCYLEEKELLEDATSGFKTYPEMEYFQDRAFKESLMSQCKGENYCIANMTQSLFMPIAGTTLFKD